MEKELKSRKEIAERLNQLREDYNRTQNSILIDRMRELAWVLN